MQDTLKKAGFCMQNHPNTMLCFRLKICQLVIQSIFALITGILVVNKSVSCSSPISVFLLGLFGTYIAGITLNFFVCFGRCCARFSTVDCKRSFSKCMRGLNLIYLPLYWVFCIVEFIWYVLGAYWYNLGGDCSKEFSNGMSATVALVAIYFIMLLVYIIAFVAFLGYLRCNDVDQPKATEEVPKNPENTAGVPNGPNDLQYDERGYPIGPNFQNNPNSDYNQRSYPGSFNPQNTGPGQRYPSDNQRYPSDYQGYQPDNQRYPSDYQGYPPDNQRYPPDDRQYPDNQRFSEPYQNHPLAPNPNGYYNRNP